MMSLLRSLVFVAIALAVVGSAWAQRFQRFRGYAQTPPPQSEPGDVPSAEFQFARMIYTDLPQQRRGGYGWWMQDWPDAEEHFGMAFARLTRLDIGEPVTLLLTDDHVFDYPWLYATQVGYWDLGDDEIAMLREYLLRGGFLMTDDFWGDEWQVFKDTMTRLFPNRPIVEIPGGNDAVLHVLYDIDSFTQIPGLRHLRYGYDPATGRIPGLPEPHWRGIYDDKGRLMVAINFNQDVGDAWEEADTPSYPEPMTALAYRVAINYIIYAMTH